MFCCWKANASWLRRADLSLWYIARYARSDAEHRLGWFAQHMAPPIATSAQCSRRKAEVLVCSSVSAPIFWKHSLSRPKTSLKSWALEDTFVRHHTHEWGDQLFYFWRYCPSSQKPICTAPPVEEKGQMSYFLFLVAYLSYHEKVRCATAHMRTEETLPTVCLNRKPTEMQKAQTTSKLRLKILPFQLRVLSCSYVEVQRMLLKTCFPVL